MTKRYAKRLFLSKVEVYMLTWIRKNNLYLSMYLFSFQLRSFSRFFLYILALFTYFLTYVLYALNCIIGFFFRFSYLFSSHIATDYYYTLTEGHTLH